MFHDAPMEAETPGVTVHCRPRKGKGATPSDRIRAEHQLHRVVDFVLTYRCGENITAASAEKNGSDGGAPIPFKEARVDTQDAACANPVMRPLLKVALQFPDHMLDDATSVVHQLESLLHADPRYASYQADLQAYREYRILAAQQQPVVAAGWTAGKSISAKPVTAASSLDNPNAPSTEIRFLVLADNTFGSCCPDEITALHYDADAIVHFGEACMSRVTRLPVLYIHPPLCFRAVAMTGNRSNSCGGEECSVGAASLVAAAVADAAVAIQRRRDAFNAAYRQKTVTASDKMGNDADGKDSIVAPRLVVVGTPATIELLGAAKQLLTSSSLPTATADANNEESLIPVDWCSFDAAASTKSPAPIAPVEQEGNHTNNDTWVVNGARFPRMPKPSVCEPIPIQHFLFVGPSTASHPTHLHGVHQYNMFHYPPAASAYLDDDDGTDDVNRVPVLFVVDENFAVGSSAGVEEAEAEGLSGEQHFHDRSSPGKRLSADASLADAQAFLAAARKARVENHEEAAVVSAEGSLAQSARARMTVRKRLAQRSFNIEAVRASNAVGILVASLAIDGYYECTMLLHQLLRAYGKRSYILYVGHLNEFKLANFADTVDCFVVVACPNARHCHFPEKSDNYMKRVVSPAEVLLALAASPHNTYDEEGRNSGNGNDKESTAVTYTNPYGLPGLYNTEFECILEPLRIALGGRRRDVERLASDAAAGTDGDGDMNMRDQWRESAALIRMAPAGRGGALVASRSTVQGSLARLHERAFTGLDPQIGQTEVQAELVQGKHGIARGYAKERQSQ